MANWLSRMFTIPRKQRDSLNANPIVHFLAGLVQAAAISSAQGVVDQHVSDPALAEIIKAQIEAEVRAHVPIPDVTAATEHGALPLPMTSLIPQRTILGAPIAPSVNTGPTPEPPT